MPTRPLAETIVALAAAVFSLVPLLVNPYNPFGSRVVPPKFDLLLILSVLLLLVILAARLLGTRFVLVPVLVPASVFLLISALSTAFSENVYLSLVGTTFRHNGLLSTAAGVLLFYAAARFLDSWERVRFFLMAGVASSLIIALYGFAQRFGFDPLAYQFEQWPKASARVSSTLGNPIFLAAYLTLMMGAAAALYFRTSSRRERILWLWALAVMGACWLYTYTLGAVLGVGVALPIVVWLAYRRMGTIRPMLGPLTVLLASVLVATALTAVTSSFAPSTQKAREVKGPVFESPAKAHNGASLALVTPILVRSVSDLVPGTFIRERSISARLLIWRDTLPMIAERPLLGHGPDNFQGPFSRHEGDDLRALLNDRSVDEAHNEFLQIAATRGLLGLAAYVWIFSAYFRKVYECGGWVLIALSGGVLAYIVQLQSAFTTIGTIVPFWAVVGVSVAVIRLSCDVPPRGVTESCCSPRAQASTDA